MSKPLPLNFLPGVQRDGTELDGDRAIDAQWTRWRLARARSMGGFQKLIDNLSGVPRRIHMFYSGAFIYVHVGTGASLQQIVIDQNGNVVSQANRTPLSFAAGPNVGWTMDAIFDTTSNVVQLVCHAVSDLNFVASASKTIPFLGDITSPAALGPFSDPSASDGTYASPLVAGGIVCAQPYVFDFDDGGRVGWSAPNLPNYLGITGGTSGAGQARISAQKIVAGASLRGGGVNSPAALFWSLSEVISATFVGSANGVFAFNTVSPSSSILSSDAVIEYDSLYFWAATDRFLVYNGTVVEVPNQQNQDWFFDNLNRAQAGKTFAFKIPRYGEIWFCAPLFGNTEPSHAAIYNVRENCWYDTVLPNKGRSAGYFAQGFRFPVMGGVDRGANGYSLWLHEKGTDQVDGAIITPVEKYFETPDLYGPKMTPPTDKGLSVQQLEPDIIQSGDMSIIVTGSANARMPPYDDVAVPLKALPAIPQEQLVSFKTERRLPRLRFVSNTLGGSYITGKNLLHSEETDSRRTGGMAAPTGGTIPPTPSPSPILPPVNPPFAPAPAPGGGTLFPATFSGIVVSTSTDYTVVGTEKIIEVNASGGVVTITFAPNVNPYWQITIVKVDGTNNPVNISDGISVQGALISPAIGDSMQSQVVYATGSSLRLT